LPALVRPQSAKTYDPPWLVSIQMYLGQRSAGEFDVTGDVMQLWAPALLQHYGPGSAYLDVSADLDVALWFSLYRYNGRWFSIPAREGPARRLYCAWYTEFEQPWPPGDGPVVYVLETLA
jgi:hypothetical protein